MKVAIASDHAGFSLKEVLRKYLEENGYEVVDKGPYDDKSVDYPDFAKKLTTEVLEKNVDFGIGICGTGIGISIACNRVKGIRGALCSEPLSAELTRRHNNANVLNLGGRIIGDELAKEIVDVFLNTEYEGGRHQKRIEKIENV